MCFKLKKINLCNNLIEDDDNIYFLSGLDNLKYLNLNQNPIQNSKNYKKLIEENLNFVERIDCDENVKLNLGNRKINFDMEEIFDLTKKDNLKEKNINIDNKYKNLISPSEVCFGNNNIVEEQSKQNIFSLTKSKLSKFKVLNKFCEEKNICNNFKSESSSLNDPFNHNPIINNNPSFDKMNDNKLNNDKVNNDKFNKIAIGPSSNSSEYNYSKNSLNLPELKNRNGEYMSNSKSNFFKSEDLKKVNLFEKHKIPSKEELLQKMEKINKELSQKSQNVTKRLYQSKNIEDFEKTAQKTLGKLRNSINKNNNLSNVNSLIPVLLKKNKDSNNLMLPKIVDSKQTSNPTDNKNEKNKISI